MLEHTRVVKTIKMNQVTAWDDTTAITGGVRQSCVWGRPLIQQMLDLAEVCYLRKKKKIIDLHWQSGKQWKNPKTLNQTEFNCYSWGGRGADVMQLSHKSNLQFLFFLWACRERGRNRPTLVMVVLTTLKYNREGFFWSSSRARWPKTSPEMWWGRCDAYWSYCFTVTMSVPEALVYIEKVSAINKEKPQHNDKIIPWAATMRREKSIAFLACKWQSQPFLWHSLRLWKLEYFTYYIKHSSKNDFVRPKLKHYLEQKVKSLF